MQTDSTSRTILVLAGVIAFCAAVWLVRDVLPPFLIALALALMLDPVMGRLHRLGMPRGVAVALTFCAFMALFFGVIAFMVPRTVGQIADLVHELGPYSERVQHAADQWAKDNAALLQRMHLPTSVPEFWMRYQGTILGYLQFILQRIFHALESSAGKISWLVIVPIVTLYLLMDLDRFRARLLHMVSAPHRTTAIELSGKVGLVFMAYLRGLIMVCASYGLCVYVGLALTFRLPYALIISLLASVLYAVPYLGQIAVIASCCTVAWLSGYSPWSIGGIAIMLLAIGQSFDQVITPRVIGKQVGLHPVLGLFALMVGAQLFGLIGMVFAVPVAAAVRVVLIELYPPLGERLPTEEASAVEREALGIPEPLPSAHHPTPNA